MTTSLSFFVKDQQITSCKVSSSSNLTASYSNGEQGVGATLTNTGSLTALVIDGVTLSIGDRVLLAAQTSGYQNGIWDVIVTGSSVQAWLLKRSVDFQSVEQIRAGYFTVIESGTANKGLLYVVTGAPATLGVDTIQLTSATADADLGTAAFKAASDNTKASVASVSAATTDGHFASFGDVAGTVKDDGFVPSDATKTVVSMLDGITVDGRFAVFADAAGTITDDSYVPSDPVKTKVCMLGDIASTVGALPVFSDISGTLSDSQAKPLANDFPYAGGSATAVLADAFFSTNGVFNADIKASTNAVNIQKVTPGAGTLTILMSGDPGAATIFSVIGFDSTL